MKLLFDSSIYNIIKCCFLDIAVCQLFVLNDLISRFNFIEKIIFLRLFERKGGIFLQIKEIKWMKCRSPLKLCLASYYTVHLIVFLVTFFKNPLNTLLLIGHISTMIATLR